MWHFIFYHLCVHIFSLNAGNGLINVDMQVTHKDHINLVGAKSTLVTTMLPIYLK